MIWLSSWLFIVYSLYNSCIQQLNKSFLNILKLKRKSKTEKFVHVVADSQKERDIFSNIRSKE